MLYSAGKGSGDKNVYSQLFVLDNFGRTYQQLIKEITYGSVSFESRMSEK